jgi:sulfur relay (sulfurtransferase) complex TusBCD TusD component (DsrE family)
MAKLGFLLKSGPFTSSRGEDLYHMAGAALDKEHQVKIFLDLDGVYQAMDTQKSLEVLELPKDRFSDLIQRGATVYICATCLTARGLHEPGTLIDGVKTADMENFASMMSEVDRMIAL